MVKVITLGISLSSHQEFKSAGILALGIKRFPAAFNDVPSYEVYRCCSAVLALPLGTSFAVPEMCMSGCVTNDMGHGTWDGWTTSGTDGLVGGTDTQAVLHVPQ